MKITHQKSNLVQLQNVGIGSVFQCNGIICLKCKSNEYFAIVLQDTREQPVYNPGSYLKIQSFGTDLTWMTTKVEVFDSELILTPKSN